MDGPLDKIETRLEGKVIQVAHGEAIVCEIPLGLCKLVVIANIPNEGERATVFVKVRPMVERRTPGFKKRRRDEGQVDGSVG